MYAYVWIYIQLLRRDGRNGEMVRHTSTVVAVPLTGGHAVIAHGRRMECQRSRSMVRKHQIVSHGPIVLRCPGNGREAPMGTAY